MRLVTGTVIAIVAAMAATLAGHASTPDVSEHTSPAGQSFLFVPIADAKQTAITFSWKTGIPAGPDVHEATARLGIALMRSGGAGGIPSDELAAELEDLDARFRLWVRPGAIRSFIVASAEDLQRTAEIANLALAQPDLDARWLEREKRNLVRDSRAREETTRGRAWMLAREILLEDHPYKRFWSIAPAETVQEIGTDQIHDWHAASFGTSGMTITAAGSADPDVVGAAIDAMLADLPDTDNRQPLAFDGPDIKPGTIVLERPESQKSLILVFGRLPTLDPGDSATLTLANSALGAGQQSRLFRTMRTELRAAYGFNSGTTYFTPQYRLLRMGGEVDTDLLPEALAALRATYEEFRRLGVSEDEFPVVRERLLARFEPRNQRPAGVANRLLANQLFEWTVEDFETGEQRIAGLDRVAVNETLAELYPPFVDLLTIVVTPDASDFEDACVVTTISDWRQCF